MNVAGQGPAVGPATVDDGYNWRRERGDVWEGVLAVVIIAPSAAGGAATVSPSRADRSRSVGIGRRVHDGHRTHCTQRPTPPPPPAPPCAQSLRHLLYLRRGCAGKKKTRQGSGGRSQGRWGRGAWRGGPPPRMAAAPAWTGRRRSARRRPPAARALVDGSQRRGAGGGRGGGNCRGRPAPATPRQPAATPARRAANPPRRPHAGRQGVEDAARIWARAENAAPPASPRIRNNVKLSVKYLKDARA